MHPTWTFSRNKSSWTSSSFGTKDIVFASITLGTKWTDSRFWWLGFVLETATRLLKFTPRVRCRFAYWKHGDEITGMLNCFLASSALVFTPALLPLFGLPTAIVKGKEWVTLLESVKRCNSALLTLRGLWCLSGSKDCDENYSKMELQTDYIRTERAHICFRNHLSWDVACGEDWSEDFSWNSWGEL